MSSAKRLLQWKLKFMQLLINEIITLPEAYSVTGEAEEQRNQLALRAVHIKSITCPEQNEDAGGIARDIRKHLKGVEAVRQELTKPLLDAQRMLKSLSDDHCQPLKDELKRLEGLACAFLESEQRRVAAEEKAREIAFLKAQQAQFEAEDKARKLAEKAKTDAGLEKAINAEEKAIAAADLVQAVIAAPAPVLEKARGQSIKQVLRYEVLDIRAVYAARPELCTIEIKPSAVLSTCSPELPVPGLRLYYENKATFSSR